MDCPQVIADWYTHKVTPADQISTLNPEKVSRPFAISGGWNAGDPWLVLHVSPSANGCKACGEKGGDPILPYPTAGVAYPRSNPLISHNLPLQHLGLRFWASRLLWAASSQVWCLYAQFPDYEDTPDHPLAGRNNWKKKGKKEKGS